MITPSRPAKIVVASGRTNCRLSVATSNQQLMFSSESWAGECGGSWRAQVIVVWDLLARIGTAEGRIFAVVER